MPLGPGDRLFRAVRKSDEPVWRGSFGPEFCGLEIIVLSFFFPPKKFDFRLIFIIIFFVCNSFQLILLYCFNIHK